MTRLFSPFALFLLAVTVVSSLAVAVAQNALAQFKISEAEAQELMMREMSGGVSSHGNLPIIDRARRAYAAIPAAARGAATTALYAWVKAHVNSPAFRKAYATMRAEQTPIQPKHEGTVDEAVAREVARLRAEIDKSVKEFLAAGMKAQADAMREQAKMFDDKVFLQGTRMNIEDTRARQTKEYERGMAHFAENLPADPTVTVAKHLRAFLDTTADVDFGAAQKTVTDGVGMPMKVFANDAYNKKPWQWRVAYEFGADAIKAARSAAGSWLKELGK
jgi:hypothetical protein